MIWIPDNLSTVADRKSEVWTRSEQSSSSLQTRHRQDRLVSGVAVWIKSARQVRSASKCVGRRRSEAERTCRVDSIHTRHDKTVALAWRPPRRRPGRQLRLDATLYATRKFKHAVDCCTWLNLNFFTKRHATRVIYRLTFQTLPHCLETQFTTTYDEFIFQLTRHRLDHLLVSGGRCEFGIFIGASISTLAVNSSATACRGQPDMNLKTFYPNSSRQHKNKVAVC